MMNISQAVWLAEQSLSMLGYFWQITLPLVIAVLAALIHQFYCMRSGFKFVKRHLLLLSPLSFSILILIWGALMEHPTGPDTPVAPDWPTYVIVAFLGLQMLLSVWLVWTMKTLRWLTLFGGALQMWFSFACSFVAGMSVTGDWL
jgi:hypothetical protein